MITMRDALEELDRAQASIGLARAEKKERADKIRRDTKLDTSINSLWDTAARREGFSGYRGEFSMKRAYSPLGHRTRRAVSYLIRRSKRSRPDEPKLSDFFKYQKLWNKK